MNPATVQSDFQIIGARISELEVHNDFISLDVRNDIAPIIDISHSIHMGPINDDIKLGIVELFVKVAVNKEDAHFTMRLTIEGGFNAPSAMENGMFEKMLEINGITALYSFARSTVASITSQTFLLGSIMLPMINVTQYSKKIASDSSNK